MPHLHHHAWLVLPYSGVTTRLLTHIEKAGKPAFFMPKAMEIAFTPSIQGVYHLYLISHT